MYFGENIVNLLLRQKLSTPIVSFIVILSGSSRLVTSQILEISDVCLWWNRQKMEQNVKLSHQCYVRGLNVIFQFLFNCHFFVQSSVNVIVWLYIIFKF